MMDTIEDIITAFAPEYLERFGTRIPANHVKVINAIKTCRTHETGLTVYSCKKCGKIHSVFRSCGNRHCPVCQNHKPGNGWRSKVKGRCRCIISWLHSHYQNSFEAGIGKNL